MNIIKSPPIKMATKAALFGDSSSEESEEEVDSPQDEDQREEQVPNEDKEQESGLV